MADHAEVEYATATGNDYPEHERTYESFVRLAVVGSLLVINIVIALAVGAVADHWVTMIGLLVIAVGSALYGLATGGNVPAIVVVVMGLLGLALG
jgi:hypothetical protein